MINVSKGAYLSANQNLKIVKSGSHQQDISGTYSVGVVNTVTLATGIDINTQFVYAFGTGNRNNPGVAYDSLPSGYTVSTAAGDGFTDVYFYVDTSNNLQLRYRNISAIGAPAITVITPIQVTWYLVEVTPAG